MASESARVKCLLLAPRGSNSPIFSPDWLYDARDGFGMNVAFITLDTEVQFGSLVSDAALQIPRTIDSADGIVADLTDTDPNVMYEVGFAHALKKPVLPIMRKDSGRVPSDLQGYMFYLYDNPLDVQQQVMNWLRRTFRDRLFT